MRAAKNAESRRAYNKTWREINADAIAVKKREYHFKNRETIAERKRAAGTALAEGYVAVALRIPVAQLTPELLELKRQQLKISRLNRQLRKTLKETK